MDNRRQIRRVEVDLPVTVTTVLETLEASIADLTEHGALLSGVSQPTGARIQIEYMGQIVFAQCRWSEIDRMGVKFLFELTDGPLYERLQMARAIQGADDYPSGTHIAMAPIRHGHITRGARTFSRATFATPFGRRP